MNPALMLLMRAKGGPWAFDSFTRPDSIALGNLETGQAWTGADFGISSNQFYRRDSENRYVPAFVSVPTDKYRVSAKLAALPSNGSAMLFGSSSTMAAGSYWKALRVIGTTVTLQERDNATFYTYGASATVAAGDVLAIVRDGNSHRAYVNGVEFASNSTWANMTAETMGLRAGIGGPTSTSYRWDDFKVELL